MGLAAMEDNVKEMSNPISESGKVNIVKNLASATAGINEQGGIKIAITAKRAHFDQWVSVAMGQGLKKTKGNERSQIPAATAKPIAAQAAMKSAMVVTATALATKAIATRQYARLRAAQLSGSLIMHSPPDRRALSLESLFDF